MNDTAPIRLPAIAKSSRAEKFRTAFPLWTGFILSMAALVALGWFTYHNTVALIESTHAEEHTRTVIQELERFLSVAKDVETGERGFLITGEEQYLEPYKKALAQLTRNMTALRELTRGNPRQQKLLEDIKAHLEAKLSELELTIDLRRTQGFEAARQQVARNIDKASMDEIRRHVSEFQQDTEKLLNKNSESKSSDALRTIQSALLVGILVILLLLVVFLVLRKEIYQRRRAQNELSRYRDELEDLVAERTAQLEKQIAVSVQAENRLRTSEEQYRLLFEDNPNPMWVFDEETLRFLAVNEAASRHYGWSREEFLSMTVLDIRPPEERALAAEVIRQQCGKHGVRIGVFHHLRKDGTQMDMDLTISSISFAGRAGRLCLMNDVTARLRAEGEAQRLHELVAQEKDRLAVLIDSIDDEIWFADMTGHFVLVNPSGSHEFKLDPSKLNNVLQLAASLEVYRPDGTPRPLDETPPLRALRGETVRNQEELVRTPATGELRYRLVSASPMRDTHGDIIGSVSVVHDITTLKQAEREREISVEFLNVINASIGLHDLIKSAADFFREQSGCEAVGLRLKEGDDFPYFETRGFTKEFVRLENSLCCQKPDGTVERDAAGNAVLECMCGNVLCGRFDPSKPFFTETGSFWTNSTTELLANTTEADRQAHTRNRCNREGYESVALIALRAGKERIGLIQINDKRPGRFTLAMITFWERLADSLAVAVAKARAEEKLQGLNAILELRVTEQTAALRASNEKLEQRVASRTAELATANQELISSRSAALNLMEDAVNAREQSERFSAAMQQERRNLQTIFDAVGVGLLLIDEGGAVRRVNREITRWVGKESAALFGGQPGDGLGCVHALKEAKQCGQTTDCETCPIRNAFRSVLTTGHPCHSVEAAVTLMLSGAPKKLWLDVNADPVSIDDRPHVILSLKDISDRKRAEERVKTSLQEKEVLLKEIHHRVKNNMQVISSLVSLHAETLDHPLLKELFDSIRDQVRTMAMVHEKLYRSDDLARIEFAEYARSLLSYIWRAHGSAAANVKLTLDVQPVMLSVEAAIPCGLILNELASNTLKHAFQGRVDGEVIVSLNSLPGNRVCLRVRDNGVGLPSGFDWQQTHALGLRLVKMLTTQLNGTVESRSDMGAEFKLVFSQETGERGNSLAPMKGENP